MAETDAVVPSGDIPQGRDYRRMMRFIAVGLVNTAFAFAVFGALELLWGDALPYLIVLALSHVVAVLEAFAVQRIWVFRVHGRILPDLLRFWSVYLGAFAVNLVVLPLLVEVLQVPVIPAQAGFLAVSAVVTYALHQRFSFRRK